MQERTSGKLEKYSNPPEINEKRGERSGRPREFGHQQQTRRRILESSYEPVLIAPELTKGKRT